MKTLIFLLFGGFINLGLTTDVVFLIDSSTSIFMDTHCDYNGVIQNFTSELVYELNDCDINYAAVQYNIRGHTDYELSNNNSYVYDKMKNYEFKLGAPT